MTECAQERPHEKIVLWQDHSEKFGYRACLILKNYFDEHGKVVHRALQLQSGGRVVEVPYVFSFSEKDRL